jgi:hypothetical protein
METPQKKKAVKKVDVLAAAEELALLLKEDRSLIEKDVLARGDELLGFFADDTIRGSFKNFTKMKIEAIKLAIDDLSRGGGTLRKSSLGLVLSNGKILTFIEPFGSVPSGTTIYSINLKNVFAFKNWRTDEGVEIPQEDLNIAIYRLTVAWSELL